MPATMEKSDIKLEYDNITKIDWNEVKSIAGTSVPQLAKNVTNELVKKLKNKEIKKPYAKVGLINGSLYLRFKDGNTHLEDVLLAKNWQDPSGNVAPIRDQDYQRELKAFIEDRKALLKAVEEGAQVVKTLYGQLESLRERADGVVAQAEKNAKKGTPDEQLIVEAGKLAAAADKLHKMADDEFNNKIHPPFDAHRTVSKPANLDAEDVADWAKSWYLQVVKPKYQKAKENLELAHTALNQIRDAKASVDMWTLRAEETTGNYASMVARLRGVVDAELTRAKDCYGMAPIDDAEFGLSQDKESIEGYLAAEQLDFAQRTLDNASGKTIFATNSTKVMQKHVAKLLEAAAALSKVPKSERKKPEVSADYVAIEAAVTEAKRYEKACLGHLKDVTKMFDSIKKLFKA